MTRHLIDALDASGRQSVLVDRRFSRSIGEVGRVRARKVLSAGALVLRLVRAIRLHQPSCVVLFATNRPASFLCDVAMVVVLRAAKVPIVHYLHTNGFRALADKGRIWRGLVRFLLGSARQVVCLGPTLVADVEPWIDRPGISIIPNATPAVSPNGAPTRSSSQVTVLFMSNLLPEKGAHVAVDIGIELCDERDDVVVLLAGADADAAYTDGLRQRVQQAGHEQRVRFLGQVRPEDRRSLMEGSDLLLFPSVYRFEAQPLTIVEAMSAGLPVVAYGVGGIPDLIDSGRSGELVEPGDQPALLEHLRALIDDRALRDAEAAGARDRYERTHSPESFARSWTAVLDAVEAS